MTRYVHGCWPTGTDRTCEDGTKGCSRKHPLTDAPEPAKIAELLEKVRALPPMTEDQRNEHRASFAYGNLALMREYADASPEKLEALRQLCRKMAGCKP